MINNPVSDASITTSDITTNNATLLKHGFLPKLPNAAQQFLNGQGNWATPSGIANAYLVQAFAGQTSVTVTHNFGALPAVNVIDSAGEVLVPLSIKHNNINSFTVTMSVATTGNVIATVGSPQLSTYLTTSADYTTLASDYYIDVNAPDKTVTLITAVGRQGKRAVILSTTTGETNIQVASAGLINGALTQSINNLGALTLVSDGANWHIESQFYTPDGWDDLLPSSFKDDATAGWTWEEVGTTGRWMHTASGSGGSSVKTIHFKYHVPHAIKIGEPTGFIHWHGETQDAGAGDIYVIAFIQAALRDGSWSSEYQVPITITPSTANAVGKNRVIDYPLPPEIIAYLKPDTKISCRFVRDSNHVNDTYTGKFYISTLDLHLKFDDKLTTAKELGAGWVKV